MFARMERKHHMTDNPLPDGGSPSWADVMSDEGKTAEVDDGNQEDMCDQLLRHFPVPGEIWVHLRTHCNYLSSLLAMYACPHVGDLPLIINGWRSMQKLSPYRVAYGTHNPAMHGLILTHDTVVPNFSWTPRLALEVEAMETVLQYPLPLDVLVMPAVTCDVVRVFFYDCQWYIASNSVVEVVPKNRGLGGPLSMRFQVCLGKHCKRGLWKYLSDLRHDRVWFFWLIVRTAIFFVTPWDVCYHSASPFGFGPVRSATTFGFFSSSFPRPMYPHFARSHHRFASVWDHRGCVRRRVARVRCPIRRYFPGESRHYVCGPPMYSGCSLPFPIAAGKTGHFGLF
jgi:hypothetical protein